LAFASKISTLSALRHRNYRLYWVGLLVAVLGWQFLTFTQLWLVYELTNSTLYLGAVGGVNGASAICLSLFGGVLADRVDKRKLIIFTQSTMAVLALILGALTITHLVNIWHVLVISALTGATSAFDNPTRQALIPYLIDDQRDLPNAVALSSGVWSATRAIGPALAGVLIAAGGPAVCFFITACGYGLMVVALFQLKVRELAKPLVRPGMLTSFKEGLSYIFSNKIFFNLIAITFLNSIFGMSFVYLLPVFAKDILAAGPSGYGFLMTAFGIGAICGVLIVATVSNRGRRGWVLLSGNILFCLMLIVFSLSKMFSASLALIALAGLFNSIYMTNVLTLLQSLVPNELRGRVMGIYSLTWSLMPLGGLQAGALADFIQVPIVVTIGGLITLCFALFVMVSNRQMRSIN
jgi:MFS family permease